MNSKDDMNKRTVLEERPKLVEEHHCNYIGHMLAITSFATNINGNIKKIAEKVILIFSTLLSLESNGAVINT